MLNTPDVGKVNKLILVNIGQGEGETRWKGWPWNKLLFRFDISKILYHKYLRLYRLKPFYVLMNNYKYNEMEKSKNIF